MALDSLPTVLPPYVCVFCGSNGPFTAEEHIVPHSLGNDLLVLAKGWVCDSCNNKFSAFESRVLYASILGVERCRMGVFNKRGRPTHSRIHGVSWFAEPTRPSNQVSVEADWDAIPLVLSENGSHGKLVFELHDESNADIARLLLKIGVEVLSPLLHASGTQLLYDISSAKQYLVSGGGPNWPYFVLLDNKAKSHLTSVLADCDEEREYMRSCGFDIFLHEIDGYPVLFFSYGAFFAGISLKSRDTSWRKVLVDWTVSHIGCPVEYAGQRG